MAHHIRIRRLDLGCFLRPPSETGGPHPRAEPVLGYLVRHERGLLLFDTGIGTGSPGTDAHYRPRRRALPAALAAAGAALADITLVVNCHLHFDHCGGNPLLAGTPILVQATELATARRGGHTIDGLIDFPGATYNELTGEAEVWPGVHLVPTPGHTDGHQSLVVRRPDGTVVLPARPTTPRPSSPPTTWPATSSGTAWPRHTPRTGPGWTGSPVSIRAACSSPTTTPSGSRRGTGSAPVVVHDVLGARVVVERVDRQVPAVAGALEPAPGEFAGRYEVRVHRDRPLSRRAATSWLRRAFSVHTEADRPSGTSLARRTASSSSAKVSTVTTGPKISWRVASAPVGEADQHGRGDEVAGAVEGFAARRRSGAVVLRALDVPGDAVEVCLRDHRADLDLLTAARVADHQGPHFVDELADELLGDRFVDEYAAGGPALLARVPEPGGAQGRRGGREIGVREDQNRRLAAEFEVHALEGGGGGPGDGATAGDRTGQGDHVHVRLLGEPGSGRRAVPGDHVLHAGRQQIGDEFGGLQRAGSGCRR